MCIAPSHEFARAWNEPVAGHLPEPRPGSALRVRPGAPCPRLSPAPPLATHCAQLRVQVVTICFHVATLGLLVLTYADTPVAKLPFTPWRVVTGLTHLGLSGQDYSECGVTCLYAICSMALKQNMGRALGFAPPLSSANGQKVNFGPFSLDPKGLKGSASE